MEEKRFYEVRVNYNNPKARDYAYDYSWRPILNFDECLSVYDPDNLAQNDNLIFNYLKFIPNEIYRTYLQDFIS